MRILLIDDEPAVRTVVARLLEQAGHAVITAANGRDGLDVWQEQGADLVITDIEMPMLNGIEVVLALRAHAPGVPVIAISGGDRSRDLDLLGDARLLGAVVLLPKPFDQAGLLAAVLAATEKAPSKRADYA